ncbi:MAG: hypothetical protein WCK82_06685 [Bacteroidota bacterium]
MESYEERKQSLQKILRRLKATNPANGAYFEKHIVFDDEKGIFTITENHQNSQSC